MLCEVLPGAIVMVDALRSVGWYVGVNVLDTLYVWYPASGVAPVQAVEYTSVASVPVAVPNPWLGLFCSGLQKSVAAKPTIRK